MASEEEKKELARLKEESQRKMEQLVDKAGSELTSERKTRGKWEIILIIICLIGLIYFLPFTDFEKTSQIEIPAISIKIPTKYISGAFPSIIAAIYIIYLYSLVGYLAQLRVFQKHSNILMELLEEKPTPKENLEEDVARIRRLFFLPTPLTYSFVHESNFIKATRVLVQIYVGIIFNGIPYLSAILILLRVHQNTESVPLLIWNIACIIIMILSFIGTYIGFHSLGKKDLE